MLTNDLPVMAPPDPQADARSLRRRLRAESRESHEALDATFDGMADAAGPDTYARFLLVNEACHRAIEPILERSPLPDVAPGFRVKSRSPSLAADLDAMGLRPLEAPAFPLSAPNAAETVGIVYVLEGSRLGAGFILSRLRGRDLGEAWSKAAFAYLEGPDEPHALRGFLIEATASLGSGDEGERNVDRAVAAADATFRYFLDVERLSRADAERLSSADAERLSSADAERLSRAGERA
ncbi:MULTISPECIES: biliverdin-producing heme oxygenase [unclassified Aureimonas]|uniref:biliverdin-producing heme oxygenase n=1 Tax=unclassified Aureimonas TaxID=2615206 RepID=UPI0006F5FBE8|nr:MULTISPECIES: biliverdin-producing heme oxygenase [unclassified Aureimonas]KQT69799.1 hypothetical protein ASG62_01415 [Aureimonas sp. Leaf427]KQT76049.1 hypothetical protein ASG54_14805 [Aureimonas sp. Leaf460]